MERWPTCMRQTMRAAVSESAETACLVIPTVNINCEWDVCDPATHTKLRAMPSWRGHGHNHIIWDYIDYHSARLLGNSQAVGVRALENKFRMGSLGPDFARPKAWESKG